MLLFIVYFFVLLVSTEDENQDALDLSLDSYMDSSMDVVSTDRWSYFNQDVASFHWEGQSSLCHRPHDIDVLEHTGSAQYHKNQCVG